MHDFEECTTIGYSGWIRATPLELLRAFTARPPKASIIVDKSASHHQSQTEIGGANPCSRHLSESQCPVTPLIRRCWDFGCILVRRLSSKEVFHATGDPPAVGLYHFSVLVHAFQPVRSRECGAVY